jgi:hypothetical protein
MKGVRHPPRLSLMRGVQVVNPVAALDFDYHRDLPAEQAAGLGLGHLPCQQTPPERGQVPLHRRGAGPQ